ncbi:hypothetical protein [Streptomyces sp. TRM75563]|uniref:hypothetical protein n=1 Tax=Streptomyces sp. TRM75563 TaxID=2817418 RepID=UPI001F6133C7|nr:hypothetical protein [Streptomyces sp. TRM75563]MCI4045445.1 hypothetical protein [Streptomyces sp. TRM75563]
MRITLMTHGERAEIAAEIAGRFPAAPELVGEAVAAARDTARGSVAAGLVAAHTVAVVARLLEVEQLLATTREALARLAADGDDYDLSDVLYELTRVGAGLDRAELDRAEHLLNAVGRAGAF